MYTVKQLSKIAGITPRTLHYYDEINLLKPTQVGKNGYRYYGDDALLRLQQIMFYRELDLPLDSIKEIMGQSSFDLLQALASHKEELRKRITRLEHLVNTVDLTIRHLEGARSADKKELFAAFNEEQQAEYEKEALTLYDPAVVKASNLNWKRLSAEEKKRVSEENTAVYEAFIRAMPSGAASPLAQAAVKRWRRHIGIFWTPTTEQLLGLADLYNIDPRFKATFDRVDPRLPAFIRAAVKIYTASQK